MRIGHGRMSSLSIIARIVVIIGVVELFVHGFLLLTGVTDKTVRAFLDAFLLSLLSAPLLYLFVVKEYVRRVAMLDELEKREKLTEQLSSQFHFLQVLLDAIPTPIFYKDARGVYLGCNKAYEKYIGRTKDHLAGKTVYDTAPNDLAEVYRKADDDLFRERGIQVYETSVVPADGKRHTVIFNKATFLNPDGSLGGLVGTILDITDLKRAEEGRARLEMAVEQSNEMIMITDVDGTIQYVNPAFERVTGYASEEAIGRNPRFLQSGRHDRKFYGEMWDRLARGETWSGRMVNKKKNGELFEEETIISPVRDSAGKVINFLGVMRDITLIVSLEKQVRTAQRMEAVGTLAGGIAHDFNNALTGILGFGELLHARFEADPKTQGDLDVIRRCAEQAATLTRQLLTFARRQIIEPVRLDLNRVIRNLLKLLTKMVGEHIEVRTTLSGDLPPTFADPGQMEQVLMNLCLNARDAMPAGGRLLIATSGEILNEEYRQTHPYMLPGRYVMLTISDTGIGMDEKTREQIFEPFFTTKGPEKGTGLGLAVVYGIVKQHKGFLNVESEPGEGSTFRVYLPAVSAVSAAAAEAKAPEREVARGGNETILLVDDDETVRSLAERTLKEYGYEVLVGRDGEEAVGIIRGRKGIDLILIDVVMPRMGGKETVDRIRELHPKAKALFMSGYAVDAIHDSFVLKSGIFFLPKPFGPIALARKVREALDADDRRNTPLPRE